MGSFIEVPRWEETIKNIAILRVLHVPCVNLFCVNVGSLKSQLCLDVSEPTLPMIVNMVLLTSLLFIFIIIIVINYIYIAHNMNYNISMRLYNTPLGCSVFSVWMEHSHKL